jgi:PKD repeat protein
MKHNNLWLIAMILSSLFVVATFSVQAAETITDVTGDVSSVDYSTYETTIVTSSPDINVDNLDIVKATYTQQGTQATVTLQVRGSIENRGKFIDPMSEDYNYNLNFVEYDFEITTSEQAYTINYVNQSGQFSDGIETRNLTSSDFSVVGDTLSLTFLLTSAAEIYENLSVTSMFLKINLSSIEEDFTGFVWLSDLAPNPALSLLDASSETNIGLVGENIQFNASIEPLTGQPPYTNYWDFGDGSSSTLQNPTHSYSKAGNFTYTFTVTDNGGATATSSGNITISGESGSGEDGDKNNQMILFLAILLIIIVIGVVIIVWIIRRR